VDHVAQIDNIAVEPRVGLELVQNLDFTDARDWEAIGLPGELHLLDGHGLPAVQIDCLIDITISTTADLSDFLEVIYQNGCSSESLRAVNTTRLFLRRLLLTVVSHVDVFTGHQWSLPK